MKFLILIKLKTTMLGGYTIIQGFRLTTKELMEIFKYVRKYYKEDEKLTDINETLEYYEEHFAGNNHLFSVDEYNLESVFKNIFKGLEIIDVPHDQNSGYVVGNILTCFSIREYDSDEEDPTEIPLEKLEKTRKLIKGMQYKINDFTLLNKTKVYIIQDDCNCCS